MTKSTNRKDDDVSIIDAPVDTDKSNDTINDNDNDNNRSNERIEHGIQTIYGDRNRLRIINYGDEERITSMTKKPIYTSYKDACMNGTITHGRESLIHAGTDNVMPPVTSE